MFPFDPSAQPPADALLPLFLAMAAAPDPGTETITEEEIEEAADLDQPWHVLIFNDPVNLMGYVTLVIRRVFGYPQEKAERMMLDVHQRGKCIAWTGPRERAEHYVRELQSRQLLAAMKKAG